MRCLFFPLLLLFGSNIAAQTMLPAAEWCAKSRAPLLAPPLAADGRSDSIDIELTSLYADITDFSGRTIAVSAFLQGRALVNGVQEIRLDLLNFTIDSVFSFNLDHWTYDGATLHIFFNKTLLAGEGFSLQIDYRGQPVQDASGWGGFYWQGEYAYNLGVGFAADPHSFGRAWFPCFDNFVERCAFNFWVTSSAGKPAYCNGRLVQRDTLPNGNLLQHWALFEPIPAYLACVAVGPFASFRREYSGETGPVPVDIAVAPADSNKLRLSFQHLPDALAAFEHWYGPYRWNKIGYSVVPFNQGAMEHATNVAYMRDAVDGTTASETLMAHEFSHHWWGDLATCSTAEDMWLNEGWAVYSEHLFLEQVYGRARYDDEVRKNFLQVLENTHVQEGGYRAVSGLPHALTYGQHVYRKGAVVPHNLRGYLGDSLFRQGLRAALDQYQFDDWSSAGLRDALSAATGYDLGPFFADWVFQPGFAHFSIDSTQVFFSPVDAPTRIRIFTKQKLRGAGHFYQKVPLEFTVVDPLGNRQYRQTLVSGETDTVEITVPFWFFPAKVWVNTRQQLTLARADWEGTIKTTGMLNAAPAKMTLNLKTLPQDTALVRIEHHYAMPDTAGAANPQGFRLSNRYWTVDALQPFEAEATLVYDGKGMLDQLDAELFAQTSPREDSILLAYRPGPGHSWQEHPNYTKNTVGSAQDRFGILRPAQLPPGQYAIAKGVGTVAVGQAETVLPDISVSPNPVRRQLQLRAGQPFNRVLVFDARGVLVLDRTFQMAQSCELDASAWAPGMYWAIVSGGGLSGVAGPFAVAR